jgi:hypothetical protein
VLVDPIDDRPHQPDSEHWIEQWQFDFWSTDHDLGGWIHFAHNPTTRQGWYVAALVGVDRQMVLVVDPELRITDLSPYLEFRAEGIWAQHVCETPLRHWTIGLEAFGVTLDDPADALGNQWGKRTGVGLDVEWESNSDPQKTGDGFTQECVVTGEVLIDQETIDLNTKGRRCRRWGRALEETENEPGSLAVPIQVGQYVLEIELDQLLGQWQGRLRT